MSRATLEQLRAIVEFMEKHPALGSGQMRGAEAREESKKLWVKLMKILNNVDGPTKPLKSWAKYWADKKFSVRSKVLSMGGDPACLSSNLDKRIWDQFCKYDSGRTKKLETVKPEYDSFEIGDETPKYDEDSMDQNHEEKDTVLAFDQPRDLEERQFTIMEKLVSVMNEQAAAISQLASASHINARAMERIADATALQANAIHRLASTFENIGSSTQDIRNAIVDIDSTMKRFYSGTGT